MGLFNWSAKKQEKREERRMQELLRSFSGQRFEVLGGQKVLFFVGILLVTESFFAELRQTSKLSPGFERVLQNWSQTVYRTASGQSGKIDTSRTPIPVHLRGYNEEMNKAIHLSCGIIQAENAVWRVENLTYERSDNDRAYFRQETNTNGTAAVVGHLGPTGQIARATSVAAKCIIVNISAGGVCIRTNVQYPIGTVLLLRFTLLPHQPMPPMRCLVLRVNQELYSGFEYGCKFLQMSKEMEDNLSQSILEFQLHLRRNG